jgi:small subunit ribosomal protein S2
MAKGAELLLPLDILLSAGIHIGTGTRTKYLEPYIFRIRPDGLSILNIKKFDERVRVAAKFIARFDISKVVTVSARLYGRAPVRKFCEVTGAVPIVGRFLPGLFSNPKYSAELDPALVIVTDPSADRQAVTEAASVGIPVIAFCDADNTFAGVDLVIPSNNKGKKALATAYWLLARQVLRERGVIPPDGDLNVPIEEFEAESTELDVM